MQVLFALIPMGYPYRSRSRKPAYGVRMRKVRALLLRFGGLFNRQREDRELDKEI